MARQTRGREDVLLLPMAGVLAVVGVLLLLVAAVVQALSSGVRHPAVVLLGIIGRLLDLILYSVGLGALVALVALVVRVRLHRPTSRPRSLRRFAASLEAGVI